MPPNASHRKQSLGGVWPIQMVSLKKLWGAPLPGAPVPSQSVLAVTLSPKRPEGSVANGKAITCATPLGGAGKVLGTRSALASLLVSAMSKRTRTRRGVNWPTAERKKFDAANPISFWPISANDGVTPPGLADAVTAGGGATVTRPASTSTRSRIADPKSSGPAGSCSDTQPVATSSDNTPVSDARA